MKSFFGTKLLLLLAFSATCLHNLQSAQPVPALAYFDEKFDDSRLAPSQNDQRIAEVVVRILEQHHFVKQPIDDAVSRRFLLRYLDNLDPNRMHFTQKDVEELTSKYATRLDDLTRRGDTTPAYEIYKLYLQRLNQRVQFVREKLKSHSFTFEGDERYQPDRRKAKHPADISEAEVLWKNRLDYEVLQEILANEPREKIVEKLLRRYSRTLRIAREVENQDILGIFLSSLTHVYDPHSEYLSASRLDSFEINMRLSLFGIGAVLSSEDGYCVIRELVPGGPAELSGQLRPGDKIVGVAQEGDEDFTDVVDMNLNRVVNLIRGEGGTTVRLLISPADSKDSSITREVSIVRDRVKISASEAKASIVDIVPEDSKTPLRLGVIDLPSFYGDPPRSGAREQRKSTTEDVRRLITRLKKEGIQGLVLDLRKNGGGYLEEAINLTGLFIPPASPVVQVQDARNRVDISRTPNTEVIWDGPLVVLLSRFSASASEILANALKDHGRAVLIGDQSTHGKGTVQTLIDLDNILSRVGGRGSQEKSGGLKITVQKFYGPDGSSTQLRGVTPDIVLPSVNDYLEIGEAALEDPLPWDLVPPAFYKKQKTLIPEILPQLRSRSQNRIRNNPDFRYIEEDIKRLKDQFADKSILLNEEIRRQEREEQKLRMEAREKERKARGSMSSDSVIMITLNDLEKSTLPEPVLVTPAATVRPISLEMEDSDSAEDPVTTLKGPLFDPTLREAQYILADMIMLTRALENAPQVETNLVSTNSATQPKKKLKGRLE